MPMDRSKYPADWDAISQRIRERSGQTCESCGVPNRAVIDRHPDGRWILSSELDSMNSSVAADLGWHEEGCTIVKVILTVHHIDADTTNNDDANLRALCQKCHLLADRELHLRNAAATRRQRKIDAGQKELIA
jgi:5-methylcytosine-specific restriction endonuclease McrA